MKTMLMKYPVRWLAVATMVALPMFGGAGAARADEEGLKSKTVDLTTIVYGVTDEQAETIDAAIVAALQKGGWTVVDDEDDDGEVELKVTVYADDDDDDDDGVKDADDEDGDGDGKGFAISMDWDGDDAAEDTDPVASIDDLDEAASAMTAEFIEDAGDGNLDDDDNADADAEDDDDDNDGEKDANEDDDA